MFTQPQQLMKTHLPKIIYSDTESNIERLALLQILFVSLFGIFFYITIGLIFDNNNDTLRDSIFALFLYILLLAYVYFVKNPIFKRDIVIYFSILTVLSGFFVLGGFKGVSSFDLLNVFLFTILLYDGLYRLILVGFLLTVTICFIYLQVMNPEMIVDRGLKMPDWAYYTTILIRFGLTINLGYSFHKAYQIEHKKVKTLIENLEQLNTDITEQNKNLQSLKEELQANNDNLEDIVKTRTLNLETQNEKLLMYAYLNNHVFRGPISRIKGLSNLLLFEKDNKNHEQYISLLSKEVDQVDTILKDISNVIYEKDQKLIEELKEKANRLYR